VPTIALARTGQAAPKALRWSAISIGAV